MLQAERPSQRNGKQRQYKKHLPKLLKSKGLTTELMRDRQGWADNLTELYPRDNRKTPPTSQNETPNPDPDTNPTWMLIIEIQA